MTNKDYASQSSNHTTNKEVDASKNNASEENLNTQSAAGSDNKSNVNMSHHRLNGLLRGLFMFLYGVGFYISGSLIFVLSIVQFFIFIISGVHNKQVAHFIISLGEYVNQISQYMSMESEEKPFPMKSWPTIKD